MELLGAELGDVAEGCVTIRLPFRDDLTQQHGYFHAGILTTIADSAGGYAAFTMMAEGMSVLATEFKMNFLRPAVGDIAIAVGTVVKAGRTLTVSDMEVFVERDGERVLCAKGMQTCIAVPKREPRAP